MTHAIWRSYLGLCAGTAICFAVLALGGYAVSQGQNLAAASAFIGSMVGLVTVFVLGQRQQRAERENRAKLMAK